MASDHTVWGLDPLFSVSVVYFGIKMFEHEENVHKAPNLFISVIQSDESAIGSSLPMM